MPEFADLTQAQCDAVTAWWDGVDPSDYDCRDNQRMARKDRPDEVAAYEEARAGGCCGFVDVELETPDGVLLYGFNYGH